MTQDKVCLVKVVGMTRIFRMEKNRWPAHAAELLDFCETLDHPLELSPFQILSFSEKNGGALSLEFALQREGGDGADWGRLELNPIVFQERSTLSWKTRYHSLPEREMDKKIFCPVLQLTN